MDAIMSKFQKLASTYPSEYLECGHARPTATPESLSEEPHSLTQLEHACA